MDTFASSTFYKPRGGSVYVCIFLFKYFSIHTYF